MKILELSGQQKNIMKEFYSLNKQKIYMSKDNRAKLWNKTKNREKLVPSVKKNLEQNCPALAHQVERSYQVEIIFSRLFLVNAFMLKH